MRKHIIFSGLVVAALFVPVVASAQTRNFGGNTSGGFGNTGGMGSSSGFGSTSGFGSSGIGSTSGFGSSNPFGNSGFGNSGGMGGTSGLGMQGGQPGLGGQNQLGGGNFIGRNLNQNQFLGRTAQGQNTGQGMNSGMGQFGGGGNRGGARGGQDGLQSLNGGMSGGSNNQAPVIRPRQRVAFTYAVPKGEELQTTLETRLTKLSVKKPGLNSVMIAMNPGGEVVLRGTVNSESESKLAENLLRLEPGVRSVVNELSFPPVVPATDE